MSEQIQLQLNKFNEELVKTYGPVPIPKPKETLEEAQIRKEKWQQRSKQIMIDFEEWRKEWKRGKEWHSKYPYSEEKYTDINDIDMT